MRFALVAVSAMATLVTACTQPPPKTSPPPASTAKQLQVATFRLCETEGFLALNAGRQYMLLTKRDKAEVLSYLGRTPDPEARQIVEKMFEGVDSGQIRHYADYAADTLTACTQRERLATESTREDKRLCFAQTDIAFFIMVDKSMSATEEQAVARTARKLPNEKVYPRALIEATARRIYGPDQQTPMDTFMKKTFWGCLASRS